MNHNGGKTDVVKVIFVIRDVKRMAASFSKKETEEKDGRSFSKNLFFFFFLRLQKLQHF